MNEIKVFEKEEFGKVRTVIIDNEPYFVGKDVAEILAYKDTADAIKKHVDNEDKRHVKVGEIPTLKTSNYGAYLINESGVYSLVFSSKLPGAKDFKRWVTKEVLPSIRKTGSYSCNSNLDNQFVTTITKGMETLMQSMSALAATMSTIGIQTQQNFTKIEETVARVEKLEKQSENRKILELPELPIKDRIVVLIRDAARKSGEGFEELYKRLYSEYGLRTHSNPSAKAKKRNQTTISYIEKEGDMDLLEAIARKLFA